MSCNPQRDLDGVSEEGLFVVRHRTASRMSCTIELRSSLKLTDLTPKEFYDAIATPLWNNGVICVKNQQSLSAEDLVKATAMLGRPVVLPTQMAFNNRDATHPEITRVGNIDSTGKKIEHYFDAKYWHTDGAYWPNEKTFITNWLQTKVMPSQGGNTAFIDMQEIYNGLSEEEKLTYSKTRFLVRHRNLMASAARQATNSALVVGPHVAIEDSAEHLGIPSFTVHDTIYYHPITGKPSLYVGTNNSFMLRSTAAGSSLGDNDEPTCANKEQGDALSPKAKSDSEDDVPPPVSMEDKADKLIAEFVSKATVYEHVWEDGDVLLWDNTQTMHRGVGGIAPHDQRLLFRTQSQVLPEHIAAYHALARAPEKQARQTI